MRKRGRGRPRYSRPGGRRYIHVITKSSGHGTSARSVAMRPDERACIFIFQRTKESTEDIVFRWHGTLGLREANRERPPPLAFRRCWAVQVCVEPRRICAARGRHRSDRNPKAQVVSQACWRGIEYVTNDRINTVDFYTYPQSYLLQKKHRECAFPTDA